MGNAGTWGIGVGNAGAEEKGYTEEKGVEKGAEAGNAEAGTKGKAEVAAFEAAPVEDAVAVVGSNGKEAGKPAVAAAVKVGAKPGANAAWGCAAKGTVADGMAEETVGKARGDEATPEGTEAALGAAGTKGAWVVLAGPLTKAKGGARKGFERAASRYE
jgi:hypothetical protein